MNRKKQLILMNAFIASQFSYCPLVWLSHSRTMHNNRVILNVVIIVLPKKIKQISLLVKQNKSVSIHQRNLQILATQINKVRNDLGAEIMKDIFHFVQKHDNLRNGWGLQRQRNCIVDFVTEHISSLTVKIWETVPWEIINTKSLGIFKEKIKI